MADSSYFWQGGRKIEVRKDDAAITVQADNEAQALDAAARAGVQITALRSATPGLVRATVVGDRESVVDKLRGETVVHHVYRDTHHQDGEYLITDSFFLKFKPDTPPERIAKFIAEHQLIVERDLGDKSLLVRVTDATGANAIRMANTAAEDPDVEYAEPNLVRPLMRFFIPSDDRFTSQWHLHAPSAGTDLVAGAGIFAPEAWDLTRGRRDVVVAVADDGFDMTHPDFQGTGKVVGTLNASLRGSANNAAIDWDGNVQPRAGDYHGTPCLGVALAEGNGTGVVGVAPNCGLLAVRFPLQAMTDGHFIVMFEKISTLADVVSCSWGVGPANAPMSSALKAAMTRLATEGGRRGKGLVFCIAAGNQNCPVQDLANTREYRYLDQFGTIRRYAGPIDRWVAAHPDAMTISASTSRKTRSAYSSWGRNISVCAPSDNWDDLNQIHVAGRGIVTTDNEGAGPNSDFTPGSRFTDQFGGTSSATPTVAGVCGLVLSANPTLTGKQVRDIIQRSADKDMSFVTDTPVNEPGTFTTGFSLWFGHGKVNAFKAVTAASAGLAEQRTIDRSQTPALAIPDAGAAVNGSITIADDGRIDELRVQVDITHTYIGDLRVDLIAPDGSGVPLHANAGGSADNIVKTYSVQTTPALQGLNGRSIRGEWKLRIVDTFRLDVGRLNSWRVVAKVS